MNFGCSSSAETMKDRMKIAHNNRTYDKYNTVTYKIQDGQPLLLDKLIKDNLIENNLVDQQDDCQVKYNLSNSNLKE